MTGGLLGETPPVTRKGQRGDALLFSEHRGVPAVLTADRRHPLPIRVSVTSVPLARGWRRNQRLMQVYSTSEKLSWEKEASLGFLITRDKEGLVGWRWREPARRGFWSPGLRKGPTGGCGLPSCPARLGAAVATGEPLEMAERESWFQYKNKYI